MSDRKHADDVDALLEEYHCGRDPDVRNRIVEAHRWLAEIVARKFSRRGEPLDDLVQVATIGILKAVERFDPAFGVAFRTFASTTAQGEVRRHYRDATWRLRVPRRLQERSLMVSAAVDRLSSTLGRSPTVDDLAADLRLDADEVVEALMVGTNYRTIPIQTTPGDGSDHHPEGVASEEEISPARDETFEQVLTTTEVRSALSNLPERDRRIVFLRYFEERTQSEIAEAVGVSQVHVSRLLRDAVTRLRGDLPGGPDVSVAGH
jgi:RNA polymerase sigma-B factor